MLGRVQWLTVAGSIAVMAVLAERSTRGADSPFKAGDRVITTDSTPVRAAEGTVAVLKAGVTLSVADVKQGWVGITGEQSGEKIAGWVKPDTIAITKKSPAVEAFEQGYAHHLHGRLNQAVASYTEAIRLDPRYARAYNNRGLAHQARRDFQRAIDDFTSALKLSPSLSAAYLNRGIVYASQRSLTKAIEDFSEAILLEPDNCLAYQKRAAAYEAKGEHEKAAADLKLAASIYRPKYDTLAHKAMKLELETKGKDYVPNFEMLDSIIDEAKAKIPVKKSYSEPSVIGVFQTIDAILAANRFIPAAQGLTLDALVPRKITREILKSLDPKLLRFQPRLGEKVYFAQPLATCLIYASIGEALGLPIQVALVPGHSYVRWDVSDSSHVNWEPAIGAVKSDHELVARNDITLEAFQNGLYLFPLSQDAMLACVLTNLARVWMGEWYGLENEFSLNDATRSPFDQSGTGKPGSNPGKAPKKLSDEERKANMAARHAKAIDALNKAIELNRRAYDSYLLRGAYWSMVGEHEKAIADNSTAIRLNPDLPGPHFGRGVARLSSGAHERAIADFDRVIRLDPELPAPYYFRGVARAQGNDFDRALADLDRAIRMAPRFVNAYQARAKIYELLGQQNKADADLEKVKSLQTKR